MKSIIILFNLLLVAGLIAFVAAREKPDVPVDEPYCEETANKVYKHIVEEDGEDVYTPSCSETCHPFKSVSVMWPDPADRKIFPKNWVRFCCCSKTNKQFLARLGIGKQKSEENENESE